MIDDAQLLFEFIVAIFDPIILAAEWTAEHHELVVLEKFEEGRHAMSSKVVADEKLVKQTAVLDALQLGFDMGVGMKTIEIVVQHDLTVDRLHISNNGNVVTLAVRVRHSDLCAVGNSKPCALV